MDVVKPVSAKEIEVMSVKTLYPEPFASMMNGRIKRKLGDHFGLSNFGVNLTELAPGALSALKHHHAEQDEFIYILSGTPTLIFGNEEFLMQPGDCFGFKKGQGIGHQLANNSNASVSYLEMGDRSAGDKVEYPGNDLCAKIETDGTWSFMHKNGEPY